MGPVPLFTFMKQEFFLLTQTWPGCTMLKLKKESFQLDSHFGDSTDDCISWEATCKPPSGSHSL